MDIPNVLTHGAMSAGRHWNGARLLTTINFVVGFLWVLIWTIDDMLFSDTVDLFVMLAGFLVFCVVGLLFFINIDYFICGWKTKHLLGPAASSLWLHETPYCPETYMTERNRADLMTAARWLDDHGFSSISIRPGDPNGPEEIKMFAGQTNCPMDPDILAIIQRAGFLRADNTTTVRVEERQHIVWFEIYHNYDWYGYFWVKNGLTGKRVGANYLIPDPIKYRLGNDPVRDLGGGWYYSWWQ